MNNIRIAYLVSQYPKVSHSFIRREILALEVEGVEVERISIRGWDGELVDAVDLQERDKTRYALKKGVSGLLPAVFKVFFNSPVRFLKTLSVAIKMGIRADRYWPYHLVYLAEACQILVWLKNSKAQHMHVHFGANATEVALLVRSLGGPPYSFTVHGPEEFDKPEFIKLAEKIEASTFVVAISSYCRSQIFRWIKYPQWSKVKEVHCGIEGTFHDIAPVPLSARPKLVCIGRLCEQKGQLLLIDAVNILAKKAVDFELVLGGDGDMRAELEAQIKSYGLEQKVRITGWISSDQVRDEILSSKALVLPSFAEGLPVVIMEAMALRRPVISTYIAAIPELVITGENGYLFPAGDVYALADALEKLLKLSNQKIQQMGESAYARVIERHSVDKEAKKLAQLFRDEISGHEDWQA
ncbi:Colanic acid biosynthesis glycosyltransferase WcaL [Candidatus Methylobacter favarea]|uniref:Colanic acid biosynthesis glycosyltransferase WcaL n=1 Tax=Candidatus Methylobacter favarea TaxID=2707345 RepID=A0A8S0X388_9GAMM|nr:glycosyltransferase family 4 protein [Candidatus Methylobacter favarea]CAA9892534.1 Colanic acid biosynthesis glycosyltransferase WcaL [Candidatus Methylobacter favarea]